MGSVKFSFTSHDKLKFVGHSDLRLRQPAPLRSSGYRNAEDLPSPPRRQSGAVGCGGGGVDPGHWIVDVAVDSDKTIRVSRAFVAHDCGLIVNPNGLRNQIEGNVIQGISRTLKERWRSTGRV